MQNFKLFSLALPIVGACMMVALIQKSLFITQPLTEGTYLWLVLLLLPFALAFLSILKYVRLSSRLRQNLGLLHAIFLSAPVAIGLISNWNGEVIALLPIYLWPVTAIMTLAGIAADAFNSKYGQKIVPKIKKYF